VLFVVGVLVSIAISSAGQAMRRVRFADLPVSDWAKTGILQPSRRPQRRPRDKGSDGSSARHNVYHADSHKEGPGGHSKWEGDDSCGSVDWREGIWWELKSKRLTVR